MNEKLRKIINHYGLSKQLKYLQSEVFELNEAIIDSQKLSASEMFASACYTVCKTFADALKLEVVGYKDVKREHIKEELSDVMVMLKQIQLHYNISSEEIKEVMRFKVNRTLNRIAEEGKNDK